MGGMLAGAPASADVVLQSGPARVAVMELFTSEGCSSCPPAEEWLAQRRDDAGLWRDFVPVAWHVNYWDRLGWKDEWASPAYTDRQYRYARQWRSGSVYTPGWVLNGREIRGYSSPNPASMPAGLLEARIDTGGRMSIRFQPPEDARDDAFDAVVVPLGAGIVSHVRRGENAGRLLHHEFLAMTLVSAPLVRDEKGVWSGGIQMPEFPREVPEQAVAVWVVKRGELEPRQAAGGWLR